MNFLSQQSALQALNIVRKNTTHNLGCNYQISAERLDDLDKFLNAFRRSVSPKVSEILNPSHLAVKISVKYGRDLKQEQVMNLLLRMNEAAQELKKSSNTASEDKK